MSSNDTSNPLEKEPESSSGHLGTQWEIGLGVAIFVIIAAIIATVIFQVRRTRRRHLQQLEAQDAERAERAERSSHQQSHPRSNKRSGSVSSEISYQGAGTKKPHPAVTSLKRSSNSLYPEHPSQKPPKYYWDKR
ncbi:hypothetical protein D9758_000981 [Tetrapyrgos nigripes]|uniref:Uncharacterized protein n=1 Tax=Tetrapyrgos nigripes TaxID=182062 RepID=A0A8H5GZP5_9AGAR|nr:hypothetical protein D9758_000981 [Tetrapyrgos nigripes]